MKGHGGAYLFHNQLDTMTRWEITFMVLFMIGNDFLLEYVSMKIKNHKIFNLLFDFL